MFCKCQVIRHTFTISVRKRVGEENALVNTSNVRAFFSQRWGLALKEEIHFFLLPDILVHRERWTRMECVTLQRLKNSPKLQLGMPLSECSNASRMGSGVIALVTLVSSHPCSQMKTSCGIFCLSCKMQHHAIMERARSQSAGRAA